MLYYAEIFIIGTVVAYVISLFIFWAIIKSAVKNAMTEVFHEQKIFVCNTPGSNDYLAQQIAENIVRVQKEELSESDDNNNHGMIL